MLRQVKVRSVDGGVSGAGDGGVGGRLHLERASADGEDLRRHDARVAVDGKLEAVGEQRAQHQARGIDGRGWRLLGGDVVVVEVQPGGAAKDMVCFQLVSEGHQIEQRGLVK